MLLGYVFRAKAHWTAKRRGEVQPEGEVAALTFSSPPEFHGESGFWSPEHFLLAAVSACFVATFRAIAEASKFDMAALETTVEGRVEKGESGFQFSEICLKPILKIYRESDRERGERLLEKAEKGCLIARSLKCEVKIDASIQLAVPEAAEVGLVHA